VRLVLATGILGKEVFSADSKKLGSVENIVVNRITQQADLFVFPHLISKLIRDHSGKIVGPLASQTVSQLHRFIPIGGVDTITDYMSGSIGAMATRTVKKRVRTVEELYYLLPSSLAKTYDSSSITMTMSFGECRNWFMNPVATPETYLSLFDASKYKGPKRSANSTMNLPSITNSVLIDQTGLELAIKDLIFNFESGLAEYIAVADPISDSGEMKSLKAVAISETVHHGDRLSMNKTVHECRPVSQILGDAPLQNKG
jgi:hypothetical protein